MVDIYNNHFNVQVSKLKKNNSIVMFKTLEQLYERTICDRFSFYGIRKYR